jgi:hypothetical protein
MLPTTFHVVHQSLRDQGPGASHVFLVGTEHWKRQDWALPPFDREGIGQSGQKLVLYERLFTGRLDGSSRRINIGD